MDIILEILLIIGAVYLTLLILTKIASKHPLFGRGLCICGFIGLFIFSISILNKIGGMSDFQFDNYTHFENWFYDAVIFACILTLIINFAIADYFLEVEYYNTTATSTYHEYSNTVTTTFEDHYHGFAYKIGIQFVTSLVAVSILGAIGPKVMAIACLVISCVGFIYYLVILIKYIVRKVNENKSYY